MGEIILAAILIPLLLFWVYEIVGEFTKDDIPKLLGYGLGAIVLIAGVYFIYTSSPSSVAVKYREDKVKVSGDNFEHLSGSNGTLSDAWYDKGEKYLIVQLNKTNYHYCEVPDTVWSSLKSSDSSYSIYEAEIKGSYDCRTHHVPSYQ